MNNQTGIPSSMTGGPSPKNGSFPMSPNGMPSNASIPGTPSEMPPGMTAGIEGPPSLYGYDPSFSMAMVGTIAHFVIALTLIFQMIRSKSWYFSLLPQAALAGAVALAARTNSILNPGAMGPVIVQKIAFGVEPSLVALLIMMTHTRLVWYIAPNDKRNARHLGFPSNWITFFWGLGFVLPDMVKGIVSQKGQPQKGQMPDPHSIWMRIEAICGVIQIVATAGYTVWATNFMRKSSSWIPYDVSPKRRNWRLLGWMDVVAALLITVRAVDTTVEFDSRYDLKAYVSSHEWPFWVLNVLPLIIVYVLYISVHPGDFLPFAYTRAVFNPKKMVKIKLEEEATATSRNYTD